MYVCVCGGGGGGVCVCKQVYGGICVNYTNSLHLFWGR